MTTLKLFVILVTSALFISGIGNTVYGETVPLFSVAPGGHSGLGSELIYVAGPTAVAGGVAMGLVSGDDIDGFSEPASLTVARLRFSVDPSSTGDPLKNTISGYPANVTDEALIVPQQVAGDIFSMTEAVTPNGIIGGNPSLSEFNNYKVVDQNDFGLLPANGGSEDDVDGGGCALTDPGNGTLVIPELYFTLSATSPSLGTLSGSSGSGADIFFDPTPGLSDGTGGDETLFASAADLGLSQNDDIDALLMFDNDYNGMLTHGDQLLFSLTHNSPSLTDTGSPLFGYNAADVFTLSFDGSRALPTLFTPAYNHGLLAGTDNLNALIIPEPSGCTFLLVATITATIRRRRIRNR